MKRRVWIVASAALFAIACSGKDSAKTAQQRNADNAAVAAGNITVAGCLARADETPGSVGTGGSASAPATNPPASGSSAATSPASIERFVLRQAQPSGTSPSSAVGTSGSGTSYTLSGDAAELRSHAGQQVEVLGRLESTASDPGSQRLIVTSIRMVSDTCATP